MQHLEQVLQKYSSTGRRVIGAFSAVSNITGLASDMDAITGLDTEHEPFEAICICSCLTRALV
jgi:selenocysteine lyase/cysteine desulfurase